MKIEDMPLIFVNTTLSPETATELWKIICASTDDITKAIKNNSGLTLLTEINGHYIKYGFPPDRPPVFMVMEITSNEWLDSINRLKKLTDDSYWKSIDTSGKTKKR